MRRRLSRTQVKLSLTAMWCVLAFVYLFPCTWMVLTSIRQPVPTLEMRFIFTPTLEGFRSLFVRNGFQTYLINSILVAIPVTLACVAVAWPAAYALTQLGLRGRFFLAAILVARMVPGIAIVVPIYRAASRIGLLDTRTVLVVLYTSFNLPFAIWLLRGFFREVPSEVREAAGFRNEYGIDWLIIGAAAVLISTPVAVFAIAMQRYLVRGLTMGLVKR